jgi:septal ring factor EnvC (AmiA/AmiB activator)
MLRRPLRSTTTLDQSKQELARQESELQAQVNKLQKMIDEAPRVAEEIEKRQREELLMRASEGGSRLDVSLALHNERYGGGAPAKPRGSMRKQRREGRIVFAVLVVALLIAALWLLNHFHF